MNAHFRSSVSTSTLLLCFLAEPLMAAVLKPVTVAAFEHYVALTEARMEQELTNPNLFLWMDGLPEVQHRAIYAQLRQGQIVLQEMKTLENGDSPRIPGGMIHHWLGIVFIPDATLKKTEALVQDYDHYQDVYKPDIIRSKLLHRDGNDATIYLRLYKKKVLTAVINTEHEIHYVPVDSRHGYSRTRSTRIAEVESPSQPDAKEKPIGNDRGILWRLNSYWRFLERDGGTYLQIESISLSRDLPMLSLQAYFSDRQRYLNVGAALRVAIPSLPTAGHRRWDSGSHIGMSKLQRQTRMPVSPGNVRTRAMREETSPGATENSTPIDQSVESGGRRREGPMTKQQIQERVMTVFKKNRRLGSVPLRLDTPFHQLKLESLDVICIVFDLEEEFKIQIPDRAAHQMRCIGDVVEGVLAVLRAETAQLSGVEGQVS